MKKNEDKIIDELFHEFLTEVNHAKSDPERFKAYNNFRQKLLKKSLSLMTCLWSKPVLQEMILDDIMQDDDFIGDVFENEVLEDRDNIIDRFKNLRKSFIKTKLSDKIKDILGEATRCYVYGFNQATVALCRAALDYLLKEKLGKKEDEEYRLSDLIREARKERILSKDTMKKKAWNVNEIGNQVMHARPYKFDTLKIINSTREVLESILEPRSK
ncbi:MAG: DUF4145 domain-containing protein [Deltaproteobacteria bacterium]|nr:DUF4145 domain-containing protein [Deltaproteobacteria bacterium]